MYRSKETWALTDYREHKIALTKLRGVLQAPAVFIHYSCESFFDYSKPTSRRITSIAVRPSGTSQTKSFSLHQVAERKGYLPKIMEHLDECEKTMLAEFYDFVKAHQHGHNWIHWNMRDSNFGFEALAHRFLVLGGDPVPIDDAYKVDLSPLLVSVYGPNYTDHGRIEWLVKANGIRSEAFLTGAQEAEAFEKGNFVAMHQSTLVKVEAFNQFAVMAAGRTLKTKSNIVRDVYLTSVASFGQAIAAHWLFAVGLGAIGVIGFVLSAVGAWPVITAWFRK